ncbi:hypothetical protein AAG589_16970 [Isoptericola sp. F-RaC21]|uniref:hypothetical protein n=1 Tax=Isoptericola sp. F-RaC21 TaxID=3141452 RepID=UPI00315B5FAD
MSTDRRDLPDVPEPHAVVPALVRDYRRLLRLFPFAYRRAHGAEMLGHLLDAAAPGRSRPARGEVVDLLRAAAREWVLAPLGSTAERRRWGAVGVLVVLSVVLGYPAAASIGGAAGILGRGGGLHGVLAFAPLAPGWALWTVGLLTLAVGTVRGAAVVLGAAAGTSWVLLGGMAYLGPSGGGLFPVLSGLGWGLALTATAMAAGVLAGLQGLAQGRRRSERAVRVAAALGALMPVVAVVRAALGVPAWFPEYASPVTDLSGGTVVVGTCLLVGGLLVARRARQALPVLAGVGAAVVVGRTGLMGSRGLEPMDVVDVGNLWALLAIALVVTAVARWVVNRVDELSEVRSTVMLAG